LRCSAARRAAPGSPDGGRALCRAQLVVVFMVGGTTYEEARAVADLNAQALLRDMLEVGAAERMSGA